ncbi:hypothetical protein PR002_g29678 [Phytophthora rubi]|uniref:Uncharacterized protein n=1 Tax=Phytophthora rubi TaxID=129364 RepID=A0A6A3GYQ0_9STRA|nr:hypothetical protein PR002_g29678 [Phytophthora rubi]
MPRELRVKAKVSTDGERRLRQGVGGFFRGHVRYWMQPPNAVKAPAVGPSVHITRRARRRKREEPGGSSRDSSTAEDAVRILGRPSGLPGSLRTETRSRSTMPKLSCAPIRASTSRSARGTGSDSMECEDQAGLFTRYGIGCLSWA